MEDKFIEFAKLIEKLVKIPNMTLYKAHTFGPLRILKIIQDYP